MESKKYLILPIKKKWFDMISEGIKKEEYREIKPYWTNRIIKALDLNFEKDSPLFKNFIEICPQNITIILKNGYHTNAPKIKCKCSVYIGKGRSEWGAQENKKYYVFYIVGIENLQ